MHGKLPPEQKTEDLLFTQKELTVAGQIGMEGAISFQNARRSAGWCLDSRKSSRKPQR